MSSWTLLLVPVSDSFLVGWFFTCRIRSTGPRRRFLGVSTRFAESPVNTVKNSHFKTHSPPNHIVTDTRAHTRELFFCFRDGDIYGRESCREGSSNTRHKSAKLTHRGATRSACSEEEAERRAWARKCMHHGGEKPGGGCYVHR